MAIQPNDRHFVLDEDEREISAAAALRALISADIQVGDQEELPIFRHPNTNVPITVEKVSTALEIQLRKAGMAHESLVPHGTCIGGSTTLFSDTDDGECAAALVGGWKNNAKKQYFWAFESCLDAPSARIGRPSYSPQLLIAGTRVEQNSLQSYLR